METIITNLEFYQKFKYQGEIWYVLPSTRCEHTWAIKRQGGERKEFPNETIVIA